jgi:tetratricopeptide (TPR) repeat protein/tRNA A-37 threonylcarbamoyl transferase component Bud32
MHLVCPHCRNPIEIVNAPGGEEILCPSCGSTFRVENESTASWRSLEGRQLGRFELIEPVGMGAFGSVYKARDPELDRIVAIKIPRAGNLAEKSDLDRFLREGRSVAQLQHPAIVAIHEVGLSDGMPYLVSEFIEGPSLSDVLTARQLSPRESAALVVILADALQYAHDRGVVHRDGKPSNILFDAANRPRLVDFGLAKREAGEITMTQDGQILGTPAYMSPEQARGESHRVDGRSDVYSLGVVLYRLLTGELPFRGNARMLVHQVLHDEPRPLRRLNDHVPRDLETICLKAMAKEPSRRYAGAGALADDLRRYLDGKAIQARPTGRLEKAVRWCKRNRAVAGLLTGLLVVFAGGFAGSLYGYLNAEHQRAIAETRREEAETQRKAAVANFDEAIAAVDEFLTRVGDSQLEDMPGMESLRRQLLTSALDFYRRFLSKQKDDARLEPRVAAAFFRVGKLQGQLGEEKAGAESFRMARQTYERLVEKDPGDRALRAGLAEAQGATGAFDESLAVWSKLVEEEPASPAYRRGLAWVLIGLAHRQLDSKDYSRALVTYQKSLALFEALAEERPDDPQALHECSPPVHNIGVVLGRLGRNDEAVVMYRRAAATARNALEKAQRSLKIGRTLGLYLTNEASALKSLQRNEAAVRSYREALDVLQRLAMEYPAVPSNHVGVYKTLIELAALERLLEHAQEADRLTRRARDYLATLPRKTPNDLALLAATAARCSKPEGGPGTIPTASEAAEARRNADLAVEALTRAIAGGYDELEWIQKSPDLDPIRDRADFKALAAEIETKLAARKLAAIMNPAPGLPPAEAAKAHGAALEARRKAALAHPGGAAIRAGMATNLHAIGVARHELGETDAALDALAQARDLREGLAKEEPGNLSYSGDLAATVFALGDLAVKRARWAEARLAYERALSIRERIAGANPDDADLARLVRVSELNLSLLYARLACWTEAADYDARLVERQLATSKRLPPQPGWAALCLPAGDRDEVYRRYRQAEVRRDDPGDDSLARLVPLIGAPIDDDLTPIIDAASRRLGDHERTFDLRHYFPILGLAEYRMGRFDRAKAWFLRSLSEHAEWVARSMNYPAMALVEHQEGRRDEAARWLEQSDRWWDQTFRAALHEKAHDRPFAGDNHWALATIWTLRREAARLIRGRPIVVDPLLRLVQARNLGALGLPEKGRSLLASVEIPPGDADLLDVRATILSELDRAAVATEIAARPSSSGPDAGHDDPRLERAVALRALGASQLELGAIEQARKTLEDAQALSAALVSDYPGNPRLRDELAGVDGPLGSLHLRAQEWALARLHLERALSSRKDRLRTHPQDLAARAAHDAAARELGNLYGRFSLWDEALRLLAPIHDRAPDDLETWYKVASLYIALGRTAEYEALRQSLRERRATFGHWTLPFWAIGTCSQAPLQDDLSPWFHQVEATWPGFAKQSLPQTAFAISEFRAGHHEKAIEWAARSLEGDRGSPIHFSTWSILALAHHRLGHADESRDWLKRADDSWDATLWDALDWEPCNTPNGLGWEHWLQCRNLRYHTGEVLGRPTRDDDVRLALLSVRGYAALGMTDRGRAALDAIDLPEGVPWLRVARARCHFELGRGDRAEADLEAAVAAAPNDPVIRQMRSDLWLGLGDQYPRWDRGDVRAIRLRGDVAGFRAGGPAPATVLLDPGVSVEKRTDLLLLLLAGGYPLPEPGLTARVVEAQRAHQPGAEATRLLILGLDHYRAGRFEAAAATATRAASLPEATFWEPSLELPSCLLLLAIAEHRLGHPAEARRRFDQAVELLGRRDRRRPPASLVRSGDAYVNRWADCQMLLKEAQAMIVLDPVFPDDPVAR